MKRILLIYTNYSSFVKSDFEILSKAASVDKYQFNPQKGFAIIIEIIKQFFFIIFKGWKYDVFFIWFADHHSYLPVLYTRIMGKKSFVVIGGYDVSRIPKLGYGVFNSKIRGYCAIQSMKKCKLNLTVSKYVDRKVRWIAPEANTQLIYNCVNLSDHSVDVPKENLILTVALINSEKTFLLKGIDTFIDVAKLLPSYNFIIVGGVKMVLEKYTEKIPGNIEIIGPIQHQELINYYKKAKIYCQFSRSESFGVAIAEAMSFGCVPIVTNIGGMPEIIGTTGIITNRNAKEIVQKIETLIYKEIKNNNNEPSLSRFSYTARKENLLKTISNL